MQPAYFIVFFLLFQSGFAQNKSLAKATEEDADEHYKHKNYLMAIPIYRKEIKKYPDNDKMRFKLVQCLLNTRVDRAEAVTQLEYLVKENSKYHEAWYELGKAYHLTNQLDKAENAYIKYLDLKPKKEEEINRYLQQIANARVLINNPVNVTFQNLGPEINTEDPDYYPFVTADETFLAFTSRRKENIGGKKAEMDGYRSSDIYFSKVVNDKWSQAVNAGKLLNTRLDEQVVGMNKDASELVIYIDHIDKFGDLYTSTKKTPTSDYPKITPLSAAINEKIETSGSYSSDGNVFFFTRRDKIDAYSDLYLCQKLPNGKWGPPYKLPETVNTKYNEDFPYYVDEESTLYFSSEGHNSMGGYDLFKTVWNREDNTFSKPENLGYPINTTDEDRSICLTPDNRVGYISSFRPGGYGDLDLYRIKFNDKEQVSKIITGRIFLGDSIVENQPKEIIVSIIATNKVNNEEYTFVPHSKHGRYVISLPVGTYNILVSCSGYKELKEVMEISDIGKTETIRNKNYVLIKK